MKKTEIDVRTVLRPAHPSEYAMPHLCCPVCDLEYTAVDPQGIPMQIETDDGEAWSGRGSAFVIPMWCENHHAFEFVLGFHKGLTHVFVRALSTKE